MKRVFFFHYNKPASKTAKSPKLSIHFKNKCMIVDHINCYPHVHSKHQNRQPHCVMKGLCFKIIVTDENGMKTATIL